MQDVAARERAYRRRLAWAALAGLVVLASLTLLPSPLHRVEPPPAPTDDTGFVIGEIRILDAADAGPGDAVANPDRGTVALEVPPTATVPPRTETRAESAEPAPAAGRPIDLDAQAAVAEPGGEVPVEPAAGDGAPGGATDAPDGTGGDGLGMEERPAEAPLRPREWVHPRVPAKIVTKRKIDDYVLLKVLVGPDGHVRDVRVLRSIPNCEECTASAVEAARQFVYDAPVGAGASAGVWTQPFDVRFSYRR